MKKFLFIVLAFGILLTFTGCDWFKGVFNIGNPELSVESVWVYEESGMVNYVQISIMNSGTRDVEDGECEYAIVFSTDEYIDVYDDTTIYSEQFSVESDSWFDTTIYWNDISSFITSGGVVLPAQEGYIGIIVDLNESIEEDVEDNNTQYDANPTAVPGIDVSESNDDWGLATEITQFDVGHAFSFFPDNDADWFSFWAWDGTATYDIVTSQVGGVEIDTYIELYDQDGATLIDSNDDTGGTLFSGVTGFTPQNWSLAGTYYIKVYETNGSTGLYEVEIIDNGT